jgi:hypothetical protein
MLVDDNEWLTCRESIKRQHPSKIDEELVVCRILLTLAHRSIKRFSYGSMSYVRRTAIKGDIPIISAGLFFLAENPFANASLIASTHVLSSPTFFKNAS